MEPRFPLKQYEEGAFIFFQVLSRQIFARISGVGKNESRWKKGNYLVGMATFARKFTSETRWT
jgi:hypothetical protein